MNAEQRAEFYRTYDPGTPENENENGVIEALSMSDIPIEKTLERMNIRYFVTLSLLRMESTGRMIPPARIRDDVARHIREIKKKLEDSGEWFDLNGLRFALEWPDLGKGLGNLLRRMALMSARIMAEEVLSCDEFPISRKSLLHMRLGDAEYIRFLVWRVADKLRASDPCDEDLLQETFWDQQD